MRRLLRGRLAPVLCPAGILLLLVAGWGDARRGTAMAGDSPGSEPAAGAVEDPEPLLGDRPGDVEPIRLERRYGSPLTLSDGRIALFDVAGPVHKQGAVARYSTDNGLTFGPPERLFDFPGDRGAFSIGAVLLSRSGAVHLFGLDYYGFDFQNRARSKSHLWHARSPDGGKTWAPVQRVEFGLEYTGASNSAFQLRSARILAPVSGLSERRISPWVSLVPYSDDDGATWNPPRQQIAVPTGPVDWYESGAVEPVGVELSDGRVWLLPVGFRDSIVSSAAPRNALDRRR